jgi:hypothetical protein
MGGFQGFLAVGRIADLSNAKGPKNVLHHTAGKLVVIDKKNTKVSQSGRGYI